MSNLLDFPPSTLPYNARSPPYVVFAINKEEVEDELPQNIPLNAVLHYIPELKNWLLRAPSTSVLPKALVPAVLRAPFVIINIVSDDITPLGLKWVMCKVMQASGLAHPKALFLTEPSPGDAVSICSTWTALDLPIAGVANLLTHIRTKLLTGPPVSVQALDLLWSSFPHDSAIVREMGLNSLRAQRNNEYTSSQNEDVFEWFNQSPERVQFHKWLAQNSAHMPLEEESPEKPKGKKSRDRKKKDESLLERTRTLKVNPVQRHERYVGDYTALVARQEKARSVSGTRLDQMRVCDPQLESSFMYTLERMQLMPIERVGNLYKVIGPREKKNMEALERRRERERSVDSTSSVETVIQDPEEEEPTTSQPPRTSSSLCDNLSVSSDASEAEFNSTEPMRGRLRFRIGDAPGLTAAELAEVNDAFSVSLSAAAERRAISMRLRNPSRPTVTKPVPRSSSRASSASFGSTLQATSSQEQLDPPAQSPPPTPRQRPISMVSQTSEDAVKQRRDSQDSLARRLPGAPETDQDAIERRRKKKVVHWADPVVSEVNEFSQGTPCDGDVEVEPVHRVDGTGSRSECRPGWACMVIEDYW